MQIEKSSALLQRGIPAPGRKDPSVFHSEEILSRDRIATVSLGSSLSERSGTHMELSRASELEEVSEALRRAGVRQPSGSFAVQQGLE